MYFKYFGFKESPFNMTPNSRYFFESSKHTEALSTLIYAIEERKGFVVITGDIGSGKTTVCRTLLNKLNSTTQTALITNTHLSGRDILCNILDDLEIEYTPGSKSALLAQLNQYLIAQLRNDQNVVVIIDEAQNLKPAVLEEIRMLSNLETENEKLIQIILLGQPELKSKLAMARLEQLRQRIAVFYHLVPLTEHETRNYILYRLKVASGTDRKYFTDEAMDEVYRFSRGVPRLINSICDSALLNGFIYEKDIIDGALMREVISESPMVQIGGQDSTGKDQFDEDLEKLISDNTN